jgi:hypothetical protein
MTGSENKLLRTAFLKNKMVLYRRISLAFVMAVLLTSLYGCGSASTPTATPTPVDIGAIQTASISTFVADLTRNAPTITPTETASPTFTASPTENILPSASPTVTLTATLPPNPYLLLDSSNMALLPDHIAFYVISPVSENPCNFYLKPVLPYPYPNRTGNLVADVTSALNILFSVNTYYIGGYPNPFAPSGHSLVSMKVDAYRMDIYITGSPARTDNPCTNRMMRDQLFKTVHEISDAYGVTEVIIWLDGLLYDDYMIGG